MWVWENINMMNILKNIEYSPAKINKSKLDFEILLSLS